MIPTDRHIIDEDLRYRPPALRPLHHLDAQIVITPSDLSGTPLFLFSYDSLRLLAGFYSSKEGVAQSLSAKLDAGQAAEPRGNLHAKAGALGAFEHEVRAQTGKALTPEQADVLLTLVQTL